MINMLLSRTATAQTEDVSVQLANYDSSNASILTATTTTQAVAVVAQVGSDSSSKRWQYLQS
jgi:hypothetical protein